MRLADLFSDFDPREYSTWNYDPDIEIHGVWNYDEAKSNDLTFSTSPRSTTTNASAVVTDTIRHLYDFEGSVIVHPRPRYMIAKIAHHFAWWDYPFIEVESLPRVSVYNNVIMPEDCRVGPGTVIGSIGFGYERDASGYFRMPHLGGIIIGNNVEIGANCCVDRGTFSHTTIGDGTKIDNMVHVAHNVKLGRNVMVAAGVKFSGSVTVGDDTWIGTNSTIMQGVTIGEHATIGIGAVVLKDVAPGETVVGHHRIIKTKASQPGVIR